MNKKRPGACGHAQKAYDRAMSTFLRKGGSLLRQRASSLMGGVPTLSGGAALPASAAAAVECVLSSRPARGPAAR